jgi:hypothetical protein
MRHIRVNREAPRASGGPRGFAALPTRRACPKKGIPMKTTPVSLLLAGLATLASGCQPEEALPASPEALVSQKAELAAGSWTSNAPSPSAHSGGHTATLLNGPGDVLVTHNGTAEIYNPYTDTWRGTASPAPRSRYSATALSSGKVLVAGGYVDSRSNSVPLAAEVYDPATGTWSGTAPMLTGHADPASVLLDSGKVLVVGGEQPMSRSGPIGPACELYDPATATWSAAADGFWPRSKAAATVLYSGKVLVTGGSLWLTGSGASSGEASFYDPATNKWTLAGIVKARQAHASVRLYSGLVMIVGGIDGGDTVELFNPYNGNVSLAAPLPFTPGASVTATVLYSGEVLVTGGAGQAALYDAGANTWQPAANMNQARSAPTATLLHTGQVLFVGGASANPNAVERFTR